MEIWNGEKRTRNGTLTEREINDEGCVRPCTRIWSSSLSGYCGRHKRARRRRWAGSTSLGLA
jgi:hypothetical protein